MIRALIFDFDGLIIDSETAVHASWRELFDGFGVPFRDDLWRSMVGTRDNDHVLWDALSAALGRVLDVEELDARRRERSLAIANGLSALPGVEALVSAAVADGLRLAIASSSSAWWVEGHLERLGLRESFGVICTKADAPRPKPDPGVYRVALDRLGIAADEAVALEDSEPGVRAAAGAGLRVVAVPGSFTEAMDFSAADLVVDSLSGIGLADVLGSDAENGDRRSS